MSVIPHWTPSASTQPRHLQGKEVTFVAILFSHFPPTDNANQPVSIALVFETVC